MTTDITPSSPQSYDIDAPPRTSLGEAVDRFADALRVPYRVGVRRAEPRRVAAVVGVADTSAAPRAAELYLSRADGSDGPIAVVALPATDAEVAYAVAWLGEQAAIAESARRQALAYNLARADGSDWLGAEVVLAAPPPRAAEDSHVRGLADAALIAERGAA